MLNVVISCCKTFNYSGAVHDLVLKNGLGIEKCFFYSYALCISQGCAKCMLHFFHQK